MTVEIPPSFIHLPPEGYSYEAREFKRGVISIWLNCHLKFNYNSGAKTSTIWGFYKSKTKEYFAPVNSKSIGTCVNIKETRNYTAMPIKQSPLDAFFV